MWHPGRGLNSSFADKRHVHNMMGAFIRGAKAGANASALDPIDPLVYVYSMAPVYGVSSPGATASAQRASGPDAYLLRDPGGIL